jgi:ABC-type Fe3+ transport system substrate-binding protein
VQACGDGRRAGIDCAHGGVADPPVPGASNVIVRATATSRSRAGPILHLKSQGAPVGFKLAKGFKTWNAPFWGMMLKGAPHPAAAQLLADYMVTKEGMGLATRLSGAVIKGLPNTFYTTPRNQKLSDLTPKKIADFQAYWNSIFRD